MDITTDRAKLHNHLKDLRGRWLNLQDVWNDPVRQRFEEEHWATLEARVQTALRAMEQLATVMTQVRHECS